MMKLIIPTMLMLPMTMLTKKSMLFPTITTYSLLLAFTSTPWLKQELITKSLANNYLDIDQISAPLLVLSYWLLPLMVMASQSSLSNEPIMRQRIFLMSLMTLHTFIVITFTASSLMYLYIAFEATLIPTMVLITRWGHQAERLTAGTYFMLYTLFSSMPLLIAILFIEKNMMIPSLFFPTTGMFMPTNTTLNIIMWTACLMAFLVKMPMYGFHLWLPKAHVEAPIAGSMVLAAILLKMGGYGMIRIFQALPPMNTNFFMPLIIISLWGVLMTNMTCMQQTDLKSLIAYSSVGHMALVISAILIQTPWGIKGAMLLMIAHGFTSSLLFCLTNISYERTHSRLLTLTKGMYIYFPLMTTWWLLANLMNIALPPLMNFTGEIMIMSTLFNWSTPTIIHMATGMIITAMYSLHMLISTQFGKPTPYINFKQPSHTREHLLITLHIIPLILISTKPELIM
uniref:NADH-ubiquinone oxidoreductase chain 4 n=1 Tax=Gerrhopilus ceylonicus TaxID=3148149 RepID=A0PDM5_9SAUR|nr:NADH dehydrogenase subunit 4 [Gerrhopilus mirus]